jgi:hypothetical protein
MKVPNESRALHVLNTSRQTSVNLKIPKAVFYSFPLLILLFQPKCVEQVSRESVAQSSDRLC